MKNLYKLKFIAILIMALNTLNSYSQDWQWAKSYGANNGDQASSLALDPSGNSIVSGYFQGTQLILGATTLNTSYSNNLYVVKSNSLGTVVWGQNIGCNGSLILGSVCTGTNGNVYVCGTFNGPILMLGISTNTVSKIGTNSDFFIGCFSSSGSPLWVKNYATTGNCAANSCSYSKADNSLCVTGSFYGSLTIGGTVLANSTSIDDVFLAKFGIFAFSSSPTWAIKTGATTSTDVGQRVKVDRNSNIFIAGSFNPVTGSTTTFGTNTYTTNGGQDIFLAKYTSAGTYTWAQTFGSTNSIDYLNDMALDTAGSVYLAGSYNNSTLLFKSLFGTFSLTTIGTQDAFIAKWGNIGLFANATKIGSTGNEGINGIGSDFKGNMYVGGSYNSPTLTIGTNTLNNPATTYNAFVTKINSSLSFLWSVDTKGSGTALIKSLEADANDNVYSCGTFQVAAPTSFATTTLTSVGGSDFFIAKLACITPTITASNSNFTVCANSINSFTTAINLPQSDVTYSWSVVGASGVTLSSTTGTATTISYTGTTSFSIVVTGTNACSSVTANVGIVKVNALPTLTITTDFASVCAGQPNAFTATGATTYTWNPTYIINAMPSVNFGSGTFTVTATDVNGCVNSKTINYTEYPLPTVTAVASSSAICAGNTATLTAGGANTYTWTGGPTTATNNVTAQGIYTVTGTDGNNCANTKTIGVTVNALPSVNAVASSTAICANGVATFTALGAITYTWVGGPTAATYTVNTAGIYTVNGTNGNGCVKSKTISLTVNPLPTITTTINPNPVCKGKTTTVTAGGASSYTWSPVFVNGSAITPTISQGATVTATDANGCVNTKTVFITVLNNPTITVTGNATVCLNNPSILTASGALNYTWSPNATIATSIAATPTSSTTYTVVGKDANDCGNVKTFLLNILSPPTPNICEVTVDSLSNYNEIYWAKSLYPQADSFFVYRETSFNVYTKIGGRAYADSSMFIDTLRSIGPANGNPNVSAYKYRIALKDTCGNLSSQSLWHQTIFIQDQQNGNFNWNSYAIENATTTPVSIYNLVRHDNLTGIDTPIGSTTSNIITDPNYALFWPLGNTWYVDAAGFSCDPTARLSGVNAVKNKTKSNTQNERLATGLKMKNFNNSIFSVYPNPATNVLNINFENLINTNTTLEITNVIGEIVLQQSIISQNTIINVQHLVKGIYFINLLNANKTIAVKKIVIE